MNLNLSLAVTELPLSTHPGHAEPSVSDRQITGKIKDALALVEVRMLNHRIVGGMTVYSFAEHGLL